MRTAPVRISLDPTALERICCEPTLFRGSVSAYDVPPSAMNNANEDDDVRVS